MNALGALAEDAVLVGRLHLPAALDSGRVRAQLAAIPTPSTRSWIFVRQLTIRPGPAGLGVAVRDALERLAQTGHQEKIEFPDFPTMAAALGRDLRDGTASRRWIWRALGLPPEPGAAVAAFLRADPLRAWEALIAWHEAALLPALWPHLSEQDAIAIATDLARLTGATFLPNLHQDEIGPDSIQQTQDHPDLAPFAQAASFWAGALPPSRPALRELAVLLSLLRWHASALAYPAGRSHALPSMRAALRDVLIPIPDRARKPAPLPLPPVPAPPRIPISKAVSISAGRPAAPEPSDPPLAHPEPAPSVAANHRPGPEPIPTAVGGVFFLLNALERIGIRRRLATWPGPQPPSGFTLLHGLARRSAIPANEPLLVFLAAHVDPASDLDDAFPSTLEAIHAELLALFPPEPGEPPGLFFLQQDATLIAAPLHLDLYLTTTAIDLRVRRAALDRNPGWVPWLGRVVHFHYPTIPTRWAKPR